MGDAGICFDTGRGINSFEFSVLASLAFGVGKGVASHSGVKARAALDVLFTGIGCGAATR